MFWLLFGVLCVLFVRNHFDIEGVKKDVRLIVREVRKIARDLVRTVRQAVRDGKKEAAEAGKAAPEQESAVIMARETQPEAQENNELLKDLEQHARTAVMLADVPTLDFPKDDPKYDSSRKKYMYA